MSSNSTKLHRPYRLFLCVSFTVLIVTTWQFYQTKIFVPDVGESDQAMMMTTMKMNQTLFVTTIAALADHEDISSSSSSWNETLQYLKSQLPVHYHSRIIPSVETAVTPLWKCHSKETKKSNSMTNNNVFDKFIFVHVFKTGGSTMRQFFLDYSKHCPTKSYATLTSCTAIKYKRLNTPSWYPCMLKNVRRNGKYKILNQNPLKKQELENYNIVGGHFRIGLMDHLINHDNDNNNRITIKKQQQNNRHLVFVRDAAKKYISGKVYNKAQKIQNLTTDYIIREVQKEVVSVKQHKYHSKYANYLLSPMQEKIRKDKKWNYTQRTQCMIQNLIDYNVTIGVTDDMTSSIDLLRHVLDPDKKISRFFRSYKADNTTRRNISPLSSEYILERLQQKFPETYKQLIEYVKYEQQVTDFAISLQKLQLEAIKSR